MESNQMGSMLESIGLSFSGPLANIGLVLIILCVGMLAAKLIGQFVTRAVNRFSFLKKFDGDQVQVSKVAGSLAYYVVLLNVLLFALEKMNITSVLDPLKNLTAQFMDAFPRIVGAAIIFYVGWVLAKIAASFVEIVFSRVDLFVADKGYESPFKISKFLSAFVLGAVLLPITVVGFEFLDMNSISIPAIAMITDFMAAVPKIVGAGLILLVSYTVGSFVVFMLTGLLEGMNADSLPKKAGFASLLPEGQSFTRVIGGTVLFFIMLTAATAAVDKLDIVIVSQMFARLVDFASGLLLGGLILLVGTFLANTAYEKMKTSKENAHLAGIARFAILGLVLAMGLKAMGLADNIVNMAFGLTLGSIAVAFAISFGVGGIESARSLTGRLVAASPKSKGKASSSISNDHLI